MLRPFLTLEDVYGYYVKVDEARFTRSCAENYAKMVMCCTSDYDRRHDSGMLGGSIPCQVAPYTVEFKKKYAGFPKFTFGQYYKINNLYLLTDVMDYNQGRLKFDEIRTAEHIIRKRKRVKRA